VAAPAAGAKEKVEKQARQLAYDTRYKVKQSMKAKAGGRIDPAAMRKAFVSQLMKSPAAPAIKARAKQMLMGEGYIDVKDLVQEHASKALFKVFVEHHKKDEDGNTIPHEDEITEAKDGERTFKVRVTDKKTGNSYVRMASRAKIADLRNNPNISSVEMTGYGEPTKSEKHKGSSTARVKKGLDPVGKEDSDVDNDGDVDSSDKYLMKRRKAIGKAMAKEDKVWAGFKELIEKKEEKEKKITGEGVDNKKLIKVFPDEVKEEMEKKDEPKEEQGLKQKQRKANMAKKQVLMKKMQAVRMGAGDQIMASNELEGDMTEAKVDKMNPDYTRGSARNLRKFGKPGEMRKRGYYGQHPSEYSEMGDKRRYEKIKKRGVKTKGTVASDIKKSIAEGDIVDEGMLVNVAKGVESGVKKFNKFDDKVTRAAGKKVKKVAKKVGMAALRGTAGAVGGAIKGAGQGAMKGIKKGLREEEMMKDQVVDKKKKKEEDDPRSMPTKVNLAKNKLRAMGLNMSQPMPVMPPTSGQKLNMYNQKDLGGLVDAYNQVHNQLDELNKQERMETAKRGAMGVGKRHSKKAHGKGESFTKGGNVGRRNIQRFETKPVKRTEGSLDKKRNQSFKKTTVLNPKSGYSKGKVTSRKLNKFGSDIQHDSVSKDGLRTTSSDHAQKQRQAEHQKRRGVKTKGTVASDIKKSLKN